MKKISLILSIIIITIVFLYGMIVLSSNNRCSGVRSFNCTKTKLDNQVDSIIYDKLKPFGDKFLGYCEPNIFSKGDFYSIDYSNCNLNVKISKNDAWVDNVSVNGIDLTKKEINSNF